MIGLSLSWLSKRTDDVEEIVRELKDLPYRGLELDYRFDRETIGKLVRELKGADFRILSIHAPCPRPEEVSRVQASADFYNLASTDEDERRLGVKAAIHTVQFACDLEVRAVVLHCGYVIMENEKDRIRDLWKSGELEQESSQEWLTKKLDERNQKAPVFFDQMLRSLDAIHKEAVKRDVLIGVENRINYHEFPLGDEFEAVFREFAGGNLRFWYDTGHGYILDAMGIQPVKTLLEQQTERLLGVHLHDVREFRDHHAPGTGKIDFAELQPWLKRAEVFIVEAHDHATREEVRDAFDFVVSQVL
jgi:sugar phosphate isomerase/epimerase